MAVYCSKHLPISKACQSWLLVSVSSLPCSSLVLRHCTTSSWDRDDYVAAGSAQKYGVRCKPDRGGGCRVAAIQCLLLYHGAPAHGRL